MRTPPKIAVAFSAFRISDSVRINGVVKAKSTVSAVDYLRERGLVVITTEVPADDWPILLKQASAINRTRKTPSESHGKTRVTVHKT